MDHNDSANYKGFSTKVVHSGLEPSDWPGSPVVCGISLSSTFKQKSPGVDVKYEYSRSGNPTRDALEQCLASLEDARFALSFSSGLSAESCVVNSLSSGDEVICTDDVYGGTNRLFNRVMTNFGVTFRMVDFCDLNNLRDAITERTKVVWIESPTNPMLKVVDIRGVRNVVTGLNSDAIIVVDNTFMTPYFQKPLALGANISLHSVTKYINGHSDVVMGAIMLNDQKLYERLKFLQNAVGYVPSPFDCYLVMRGMRTLPLRMERHQQTALSVSRYLEDHDLVSRVIYPGLKSHPQYAISLKQTSGFSGMISIILKGNLETARRFLESLKVFTIAESLGGYESLVEHPAIMTHASVPPEQRKELGISDVMIRVSIGLEDAEDLIDDLQQALEAMREALAACG